MSIPKLADVKLLLHAAAGLLWLGLAALPVLAADAHNPPVRIAVFDFELEDVSAAAALPDKSASNTPAMQAIMQNVSTKARQVMAQSGRYSLVDVSQVDAKPVREKSLADCDGCENAIALQLGAEQAMIGLVRRISMTDYYVLVQISECRTGKVLTQEVANFAGGDDGWANGVANLIRHQVLALPP
jgi:Protein of unknown function (DUF2380)